MTSADGNGVYLTHEEHAALLAERDALRNAQSYTYIGKDGKPILARDLEDQRDALLAERDRLREAIAWASVITSHGMGLSTSEEKTLHSVLTSALKGDQT